MLLNKRNFLVKAALLCVCCFFLWACENDMKDIKALTDKRTSIEEGIKIESYLSQQAKVKAKLTAPLMKRFQTDSPYVEFPRSLHVDFYDDTLRVESQLNAKYGKYRESEHKVFLKDSVVVFNIKGDTLHCLELWWDQQTQKFYTDKPVRIHQPDKIIYGTGLEAAQNFSWWVIKNAKGPVQVPKDNPL
jgi:LPS export ABC transporter protein LptC